MITGTLSSLARAFTPRFLSDLGSFLQAEEKDLSYVEAGK